MNIFKFRRGVWRVFWPYIRPYSWKIGLALVILLLDTLADLASPWPIKLIFDNVLLGKHLHQPWSLIIPQALAQNHLHLFIVLCATFLLLPLVRPGAPSVPILLLSPPAHPLTFPL